MKQAPVPSHSSYSSYACRCLLFLVASLGQIACASDPVHDGEVTALGPEAPGIPKGEYHRAGQPCLVCHGGEGPASKQFSVAGTVFGGPFSYTTNDTLGVGGAMAAFVDDNMSVNYTMSNCVGNFWLAADSSTGWPNFPAFPLRVEIISPAGNAYPMPGHIGRDGSCATCHQDPTGLSTLGHVWVTYAPASPPSCPVNPIAGGTP
jgi:hypothetical protein